MQNKVRTFTSLKQCFSRIAIQSIHRKPFFLDYNFISREYLEKTKLLIYLKNVDFSMKIPRLKDIHDGNYN